MQILQKPNPVVELKKSFKKKPSFKRYHGDRYKRLRTSWRKPRGIDSRIRKKHNGTPVMPNKRFRNPKILRDVLPNGFREVVVNNVNDLKALTMLNRRFCATIGKQVGARKRIEIVEEGRKLGILITNENARLMETVDE